MKILIVIIMMISLSGCVLANRNWLVGQGKREIEYYEDGSIKRELIESDIVPDLNLIKTGE